MSSGTGNSWTTELEPSVKELSPAGESRLERLKRMAATTSLREMGRLEGISGERVRQLLARARNIGGSFCVAEEYLERQRERERERERVRQTRLHEWQAAGEARRREHQEQLARLAEWRAQRAANREAAAARVAEAIRLARVEGLTVGAIAKRLSAGQTTVRKWVSGGGGMPRPTSTQRASAV